MKKYKVLQLMTLAFEAGFKQAPMVDAGLEGMETDSIVNWIYVKNVNVSNNEIKLEPIHKFNNGNGATLCHNCKKIIIVGFTEDLYCYECELKNLNEMKTVIVIQEEDMEDGEISVIGVASSRESALNIIKEYYGKDAELKDFKDVRDYNFDFSARVIVEEPWGGTYLLNGFNFKIDLI